MMKLHESRFGSGMKAHSILVVNITNLNPVVAW